MCGIVAMHFKRRAVGWQLKSSNELDRFKTTFTSMLIAAQSRGRAATGIMLSRYSPEEKKNKAIFLRVPVPAKAFTSSKEYKDIMDMVDNNLYSIVGHTRAVTNGSAENNKNNHPHKVGGIVGVHNGNINNYREIWSECGPSLMPSSSCDSEAIFAYVEKRRVEGENILQATAETMSKLKGWFSFMLMDLRNPNQLIIARDGSTPLHALWHGTGQVTLIASELEHITESTKGGGFIKTDFSPVDLDRSTIYLADSLSQGTMFNPALTKLAVKSEKYSMSKEDEDIFNITMGV